MKFILILIVLFALIIPPVSAISYNNGSIEIEGEGTQDYTITLDSSSKYLDDPINMKLHYKSVVESGNPIEIAYRDVRVSYIGTYSSIPQNVGGPFLVLDGTTEVGSGNLYIRKQTDHGGGLCEADFVYYFDEGFNGGTDKIYNMPVYAHVINDYYQWVWVYQDTAAHPLEYSTLDFAVSPDTFTGIMYTHSSTFGNVVAEYTRSIEFINIYNMTLYDSVIDINITRGGFSGYEVSSSLVVRNNSDLYYDSGYTSLNSTVYEINNTDFKFYIEPEYSGIEYLIYQYVGPAFGNSVGIIELNQTSYTDPETVQIDAELTTYDFDNRHYYFVVDVSEDLDVWHTVSGSYNDTTRMTSTIESRTLQINIDYYDLPIWIRATLKEYNPSTGIYTDVAYSTTVLYNPPTVYDYIFSGSVFDAGTGSPIDGATVSAVGPITTLDITSSTGRFTLYLVGGNYNFNTTKSGYIPDVFGSTINSNVSGYDIQLTQLSALNGTINGIVKNTDTGIGLQDVHLIFTNSTDRIDTYTGVGGYYSESGFDQSETYNIRAIRSGYYTYTGSITTSASGGTSKSFDMVQINYSVTPTPTVLATYPGGEGHEWTNDEIVTMLRVLVPSVFMLLFIFLLLAVIMGVTGSNGGNGGNGMGMKELWRR